MGNLSKYKLPRKNGGRLLIVIAAVLLLELLSVAQYYLTHNLLEEELEKRAELELTMKAIILKKIIDDSERTLKSHIMEVKYNLSTPDSLYNIMKQIAKYSPLLKGCGIAFDPDYYEDRGVLFEPYALRTDSGFLYMEAAAEAFDYTKNGFYKDIKERKENSWVGPYDDVFLKRRLISYAVPIYEFSGDTIAVLGVDIDTYSLGDTLNRRHIYPSSFDFLLTAEGELIAGPSDSAMQKDLRELVSIMADSTVTREKSYTGRTTMIDVEINGREGSLFYASMRSYPNWQVAVVCYDDEVYASLMQLRFRLLLLSFVAFGVLLFLVFRFWAGEKELHIKKLEQERIDGELRIASNIQQSLLPEHESSLSGVSEISVEGRLIPAKAVGGDLYNAFVRDGKLFFCIGDVSGKGVPCALIMAITQALFRDIASRESNPAHIMKRLNEMACRNNKANIFVTLFIGVLDLPTGNLHYCNAGHELPIFIDHSPLNIDHSPLTVDHSATPGAASERSDGQPSEARVRCSFIEAKPNLPIGLFDDFQFEMQTMTLKPGDAFFLYTDGLTEARSADNKLFGRERVVEMITRCGMSDPKQLVETVVKEVTHFSENREQSDDLTLLAFRYTPSDEQNVLDEELILHNDVKEVEKLGVFVKQVAGRLELEKKLTGKLRLAVEEAVVNVMEYAYPAGKTGEISIQAVANRHRLKFVITDSGVSFNPTEASAPDTTLSAEERPVGGLGILLVRELMDTINYERIDGKNVLTLSKRLAVSDSPPTSNP